MHKKIGLEIKNKFILNKTVYVDKTRSKYVYEILRNFECYYYLYPELVSVALF